MHIIHYSHSDLGAHVASSEHVLQISENLAKLGHKATILVPGWGKTYPKNTLSRIIYVPFVNLKGIRSITFELLAFIILIYLKFKGRPSCIYQRRNGLDPFPALYSLIFKVPLITEINEILTTYRLELKLFILWKLILVPVERLTFFTSSIISPLSETQRQEVIKQYPGYRDKVIVQPSGVDMDVFRPLPREESIRELGLLTENFYIVWVGTFFPWIGLEILVDITPKIIDKNPYVRFILVGDGAHRPKIEDNIKEAGLQKYFILPGYIPKERLPLYYSASSICIAPYRRSRISEEGFPSYKVFEYLASGRPVICTRGRGNVEMIEDHHLGFLVKPENPEELTDAILTLLQNPEMRKEMGNRAREVTEKEGYDWEGAVREIEAMINRTIRT